MRARVGRAQRVGGSVKDWTSPADLKAQLLRLWDRDELLGAQFPLQLRLRGPVSAALSERFDEVRAWVAELQQGSGDRTSVV